MAYRAFKHRAGGCSECASCAKEEPQADQEIRIGKEGAVMIGFFGGFAWACAILVFYGGLCDSSSSEDPSLFLDRSWIGGLSACGLSPMDGACPRTCLPNLHLARCAPGLPDSMGQPSSLPDCAA